MQLSVLAATYLIGAVDAALLSLLGDVVVTPPVVALIVAEHRPELRTPAFVVGFVLSVVGGSLAIVGGHGLRSVPPAGWLVVVAVPMCVAFYFVLSARAGASAPVTVVVGQSMLAAAVGSLVLAPVIPGGLAGVLALRPVPAALLAVNGVASFFVAPMCYFRAIAKAGLVLPPMLMTGIPVFTLLLSAVVLAVAPAPLALLGVPLAAVGGVIALAAGAKPADDRPAAPVTPSR